MKLFTGNSLHHTKFIVKVQVQIPLTEACKQGIAWFGCCEKTWSSLNIGWSNKLIDTIQSVNSILEIGCISDFRPSDRPVFLCWKNLSLSPRFCGPFQVLQCIGKVAYRLDLLADVHIHPIFHVSCLKKKIGEKAVSQSALPTVGDDGRIRLEPIVIWDRQLVKKNNCAAVKVLVQWSNSFAEDVTWEDWDQLRARFSRRTVMTLSYSRIALIKLELMENMLMAVMCQDLMQISWSDHLNLLNLFNRYQ